MSTTAKSIIEKVSTILHDTSNIRWPVSELLDWLNMGQVEIVSLKPDANISSAEYQLIAGTKQSLPDGTSSFQDASAATLPTGLQLLDVPMNMGTDGLTPGRAVKLVDREIMDAINPEWHQATASAEVKFVMYDQVTPNLFYVSPPQPSSSQGYLAVIYSALPVDCDDIGETTYIGLPDRYAGALLNYILYRAYSKDTEVLDGESFAFAYYNTFLDGIERQDLKMKISDPNINSPSVSVEK